VKNNAKKQTERLIITMKAQAQALEARLTSSVTQMAAAGMKESAILETLTRDLSEGGRLFSGIRSAFGATLSAGLEDISQQGLREFLGKDEADQKWEWVTTSGNPCKDCEPRHGEIKTWQEWEDEGLPRSGFSVCDMNCKCVLVPAEDVPADFGGPVIVPTLAELRKDYQEHRQYCTVSFYNWHLRK